MLPFSRRRKAEEIELGDDDIVVLHEDAIEVDVAELEIEPVAAVAPVAPASVRHRLPPVSVPPPKLSLRRDSTGVDRFGDDVADECLESIRAATSRARLSDSFPASIVPPPPRLPSFEISDADETTRRPAMSSSPMPVARESVPGVASASSTPAPVFARTSSSSLPAVSSVAPVSMSSTPGPVEPTVILVRQPPRTGWVVAAAFLGAACALFAMHLLARPAETPAAAASAVAVPPPPVATTAAPVAPPAPPATVRFNDDQGVAVVAPPAPPAPAKPVVTTASIKTPPAPASPAKAAAKPAASLGPKLPDGSMALGARASDATTATKPAAPAAATEPAPASNAPKKKLTPEQELAEAQLKASMR